MDTHDEKSRQGSVIGEIETFLRGVVEGLEPPESGYRGPGRPAVLPSLCLWAGLLVCVLRGFSRQAQLWRLLAVKGLWEYPRFRVSDQAVYHRLARSGTSSMEHLFALVSQVLRDRLLPYAERDLASFAPAVYAMDQTTLDKVGRTLPALRDAAPKDLLPGKLAAVFDVRLRQWRRVMYIEDADQNEKVSARSLLGGVEEGALILADLGYFGFAWFDDLTDSGYRYVSRLRDKTSYSVIHTYYESGDTLDCVVWLGKYRADRARHAVRLVRFRQGGVVRSYITNVLEPEVLPMREVARLYARRWDIEMAFGLIKRELGLHLLWSAKTVVILQQVWAVLTISQLLHALRLEVAGKAGVEIEEVSMPLLVEYMPEFASDGRDPVEAFVELGRFARFIRPSRRTRIQAPQIPPEELCPLPPHIVLEREPRYAGRRCSPTAV